MNQIVKELALRYPQTKSSILLQIFEDKSDPCDLYKLHTEFGFVSSDAIDDEFFMTKGKIGTRKRLGSPKDLGSVKRWSNAFLQFVSIIIGKHLPSLPIASGPARVKRIFDSGSAARDLLHLPIAIYMLLVEHIKQVASSGGQQASKQVFSARSSYGGRSDVGSVPIFGFALALHKSILNICSAY